MHEMLDCNNVATFRLRACRFYKRSQSQAIEPDISTLSGFFPLLSF